MRGDAADGIALLQRPGVMGTHPGSRPYLWHLAVFHVDQGETIVRSRSTTTRWRPRDGVSPATLVDASALLWRLELAVSLLTAGGAARAELARQRLRGARAFKTSSTR
jgi:hypothetical protein